MLNKKGFALTEVLVVTVFLVSIFTFIYMSVIPLIGRYEDNIERVKDIDVVYKLYHIREMIKDDTNVQSIISYSPNEISCDDLSEENQEYCTNLLSQLDVSNGEIYYIKDVNYETIDSFENGEISEYLRRVLYNAYRKCEQYYDVYSEYAACINNERDRGFFILKDNNKHTIAHLKYNVSSSCETGQLIPKIQQVVTSGDGLYKDNTADIRYYYRGANPNNYIRFAGSLWRIISIESDGRMKIISTTSGTQMYDAASRNHSNYCTTAYGCNAWGLKIPNTNGGPLARVATINTYLNGTYLTNLKRNDTFGLVENTIFYAGGIDSSIHSDYKANQIRTLEQSVKETSTVGLITLSDYMKASTSSTCTTYNSALDDNGGKCKSNNWLNPTQYVYIMTPRINTSQIVMAIGTSGIVGFWANEGNKKAHYPVVYLDATLPIGGTGTQTDPFELHSSSQCSNNYSFTCTVDTSSGYSTNKVLKINTAQTNVLYSFDGINFDDTRTKSISSEGKYYGYIKNLNTGLINSCSITIKSRNEYQHNTCTAGNSCYYCPSGEKYTSSGFAYCCIGNKNISNEYDCEASGYAWCTGISRCGSSLTLATYGQSSSYCGCNTWDTSDNTWYTNSCGNGGTCSDRDTRKTYSK